MGSVNSQLIDDACKCIVELMGFALYEVFTQSSYYHHYTLEDYDNRVHYASEYYCRFFNDRHIPCAEQIMAYRYLPTDAWKYFVQNDVGKISSYIRRDDLRFELKPEQDAIANLTTLQKMVKMKAFM